MNLSNYYRSKRLPGTNSYMFNFPKKAYLI